MPINLVAVSEARRAARSGAGRRIRQLALISQSELAASCSVSHATVSRWESSSRLPTGKRAMRYTRALADLASSLDVDDPAVEEFKRVAILLGELSRVDHDA